MFSRHVTKDISAYCHGELSNEESKQFAEHIISCIKCRTKFEEIKLGIKLAEQLPQLSARDHLWSELEPLLAKPVSYRTNVGRPEPVRRRADGNRLEARSALRRGRESIREQAAHD